MRPTTDVPDVLRRTDPTAAVPAAAGPLSGLRVLDLTQFLSGPYCTQMLGDLGAQVIKVEPAQGDFSRTIPPHFVGKDSVYYLSVNRNKVSVAIDMKMALGVEIARRMAGACDVVVENFRPGVLGRLGLDANALRAQHPGLIWCSISGFGQDGPARDKPAYDMIVQALSGGMSLTGEPGRAAVRAGIPIGDIAAGMYAATAILAALHRRGSSGRGDAIDISMLDCQVAMLSYQAGYYLQSGQVPARQGAAHDSIPTYRSFKTEDGIEIVITANTERMWQGLCEVLGVPELIDDPRFKTNRERHENRAQLWPVLEAAFLLKPASDLVPLLEAETIPVAVVNTLDRAMSDAQVVHRGMVLEMTAPDGRHVRVTGNPMFFAEAKGDRASFPPELGAETIPVLRTLLGASDDEIGQWIRAGAVLAPEQGRAFSA